MARLRRTRPRREAVVVPLSDYAVLSGRRENQVGTLARGIFAAERCSVVTPETYVVLADVFRQIALSELPPGHDPASLIRTILRPSGTEHAARAREQLLRVDLDADLEKELDEAFRTLSDGAPSGLAVRASAVLPEAGLSRAAGLSSSVLAVSTREELGRAIRRVWSLAASERALTYLRARKIRDLAVAVVIQPVVPAELNLTLVTDGRSLLGPAPGGEGGTSGPVRLVSCARGLGRAGADPSLAELVHMDAQGAVVFRRAGGPQPSLGVQRGRLALSPAPQQAPEPLSPGRLSEVNEMARRLAPMGTSVVRCAAPRTGELVVLDVEPLHHSGLPGAGSPGTLWGRVAESGAAEPLSRLSRDLSVAPLLARAERAMGEALPRASKRAGLVAAVDGRLLLNLSALVERAGDNPVARIETAGAQWNLDIWQDRGPRPMLPIAGLRLAQLVTEQTGLADEVTRFERNAEQQRRWLAEMDLAILPDDALATTLAEVFEFLSGAWKLDARASAAVVTGHGLLQSVLAKGAGARAAFFAHAISAGTDVVTGRAARALCHVASIARLDAEGARSLEAGSPPPEGPLARAVERFLGAYGDRGIGESDLRRRRFAEDRAPVFAMLRVALSGEPVDPDVVLSRVRGVAHRELSQLEPRLSFFEARLSRELVSRYRELLRLRERCRARVAHGLSMMRFVARDVDRRIRRIDPSLEEDSALFLTMEELGLAVKNYRDDLSPIVRARRLDLAEEEERPAPPPCFRGAPGWTHAARVETTLRGIPCGGGTAEGKVTRLRGGLAGIERFSPGDVLVVESLDLGHAPLFFHARAVLSELGTPMSSASVVARDAGIPLVTGLEGLVASFRDGDWVTVDGDTGTVSRQPS